MIQSNVDTVSFDSIDLHSVHVAYILNHGLTSLTDALPSGFQLPIFGRILKFILAFASSQALTAQTAAACDNPVTVLGMTDKDGVLDKDRLIALVAKNKQTNSFIHAQSLSGAKVERFDFSDDLWKGVTRVTFRVKPKLQIAGKEVVLSVVGVIDDLVGKDVEESSPYEKRLDC